MQKATPFYLEDTNSNDWISYDEVKGSKGTLLLFLSNTCPEVLHAIDEIVRIANDYRVQGLGVVAISSNSAERSPEDTPEKMTDFAFRHSFSFPYLYDHNQEMAKNYGVEITPSFLLYNTQDQLVYFGQLDDSRPDNTRSTSGSDLRNAIDGLLYHRATNPVPKPSTGCNIIWKKIST